jgi:3-phosphoshikimate 1-carboxyvinyltransferase
MILTALPSRALSGRTVLPGDKSLSHRAALFASLAEGRSCIHNFLTAGVTEGMLRSFVYLGISWSLEGSSLTVDGRGLHGYRPPKDILHCGNSATTLRLLTGALAASGVPGTLDGTPGLRARPMRRLTEPLQRMGVPIDTSGSGGAPLTLSARQVSRPLQALDYTMPVASAQVKSAVLLAGLAADGLTILREPGPSRDHTERMLAGMGFQVTSRREAGEVITTLDPSGRLSPMDFTLPGDLSSAAFLLVAALIVPGSEVTLCDVGLNPTRTGLIDSLLAMGADIRVVEKGQQCGEPLGDITARSSQLNAIKVSGDQVVRMIDEFPIFAVAAACAHGITVVAEAGELRYKESDRITALCGELRRIGVDTSETTEGFTIRGGRKFPGGTADAHGDHRLAMALAVAGLAAGNPVSIAGAESISESFPGFVSTLRGLGAFVKEAG